MKSKLNTIIMVGFALFAMFFGAGNLILPPFIGLETGSEWLIALAGFFYYSYYCSFSGGADGGESRYKLYGLRAENASAAY